MRRKNVLLGTMFLAACLLGGAGFGVLADRAVTANANVVKKTISDVSLVMKKGASVRYASSSEESGIRFSVNLSAADYLGLEANEGGMYASVSYGMAIMPYSYLAEYGDLTAENLFGDNAKYDWAQWNGDDWIYTGDNTAKKRIVCFTYGKMTEDKDDANSYVFSGSMSGIQVENLARDFVGRGYIKVVKADGSEEYLMADYADGCVHNNVRSIVEVAEKAYANEKTTQAKLNALRDYYLDATEMRSVKFYNDTTLLETCQTMRNYTFNGGVTLGDGFSHWENENGEQVTVDSTYEIVETTKLYAVFVNSEESLQAAAAAVNTFLGAEITLNNFDGLQAQYQTVKTVIESLDARTYNHYVTDELLASINAKVAEINRFAETASGLLEPTTEVLYTGQALINGMSVLNANGAKPFLAQSSGAFTGGVHYDCSGTEATDWTVSMPKIDYSAYQTVSLSFRGASTWQTFGFINGGRIADSNAGALAGTITFTTNDNGTVTCTIAATLPNTTISYTITDSAVIHGTKAFGFYWNHGAVYRGMHFSPISGTSVEKMEKLETLVREEKEIPTGNPYVAVSQKTYAENLSMSCNNGQTLPLALPAIDYSIYQKVTFSWTASDWTMFGQGSDLWFDSLGGGNTGGTGEIVSLGNGTIRLTMSETAVKQRTYTKTIVNSSIASGQTALELHGYGYANGRTFTVSDLTAYNGKMPVGTMPYEYVLKNFSYSTYETKAVDVDDAERYLLVNFRDGGQGVTLETQNRNPADTTENLYAISLPWIDYTKYSYVKTTITTSNGKAIGLTESNLLTLQQYYDSANGSYPVYPSELKLSYTRNSLVVTLTHQGSQRTTIITDQDVIYGRKGFTFYVVGVQYTGYTLHNMMATGRGKTIAQAPEMELDLGARSGDTEYSEYRIAWYANDEWTHDYYNYEFAANELADFLSRWTGREYQTVRMYDGAAVQPDSKYIVLGGSLAQQAGMTLDGITKNNGYKIVQDYTNLYIYGPSSEGTLAGVYGFLKEQADVTFYTDEVFTENVTENSATVGAGMRLIFNPSFDGAQAGYAEVQYSEAYQRRLGMYADWYVSTGAALYGAATTWDASKKTGLHNMMQVFPYDMYGATYPDWYVKDGGGNWQLNFSSTNTHIQEMRDMFVESAKVAIENQPQFEYFEFAQADTLYGLDIAGYLAFMNYAAERLDAWLAQTNPNRTIALVMYAYNGTRIAPSSGSIYNGDNVYVTVCFAPVGMRYTDKVDASDSYHKNTDTNKWDETATTYEALLSWTKLTGFDGDRNLIFWMYGTDFYNYMMPIDTLTNLQYNYQKLYEVGTGMIKYQFQTKSKDNVGSDWQRLKTYLASELTKDVNADMVTLQANFMNAMYGAGASYMQQLLSAQQAYCTYDNFNGKDSFFDSKATENFFGVINGSSKLMSKTYFDKTTLKTWMGYIDSAKAAVNADTSLTAEERAAMIDRIDVEGLSIRYMLIKLHSDKTYDASVSAWQTHAASLGCHTLNEGDSDW